MSDVFCKECGRYHASLTVCPSAIPGSRFASNNPRTPDYSKLVELLRQAKYAILENDRFRWKYGDLIDRLDAALNEAGE